MPLKVFLYIFLPQKILKKFFIKFSAVKAFLEKQMKRVCLRDEIDLKDMRNEKDISFTLKEDIKWTMNIKLNNICLQGSTKDLN